MKKLPEFKVYYGSESSKGHVATLKPQRKGIRVRAVIRKIQSPKLFSGDKLVPAFLDRTQIDGSPQACYMSRCPRPSHACYINPNL